MGVVKRLLSSDSRREGSLCHCHASQVHQGQHWVHQAPAEAAQGRTAQCWGDLCNSYQLRQLVDGHPAGPAGQRGKDAEEGADQVTADQVTGDSIGLQW